MGLGVASTCASYGDPRGGCTCTDTCPLHPCLHLHLRLHLRLPLRLHLHLHLHLQVTLAKQGDYVEAQKVKVQGDGLEATEIERARQVP